MGFVDVVGWFMWLIFLVWLMALVDAVTWLPLKNQIKSNQAVVLSPWHVHMCVNENLFSMLLLL
jgi:hypothetical protein